MKKHLLTLLFILLATCTAAAATAKINKVWLEHGVKINNRSAMKVHCDFSVDGMAGKKGSMCIWIKGPSGNWHKVKSQYKSSAGNTYFKWDFTPKYDSSRYSDYWYAPYIDDLSLLAGKNKYTVIVTITDNNAKTLAQSDGVTFTGTGSSAAGNSHGHKHEHKHEHNPGQKSGNVQTWREELGYGGFVIVHKYPNGYIERIRYGLCKSCRGTKACSLCYSTGLCNVCGGQGGIISAGYGNYYPCQLCGGTGLCSSCKGTKQCYCTTGDNEYPGHELKGFSFIAPGGTVITREDFYKQQREDDDEYRKNKTVCPDCGGTRLWQRGRTPEYAQPVSDLVGVYNPAGTICEHCGYSSAHWHSKCATCKHYYGTENPYR